MHNKTSQNLELKLVSILNGSNFNDWCEDVVDKLSNECIPTNLKDLFNTQHIKEVIVNTKLSYPAKIEFLEGNFKIEIKDEVDWNTNRRYRFLIAHEIAHTLQYSVKKNVLVDNSYFLPGSFESEYFCNRIARSFLLPRKNLKKVFEDSPLLKYNVFSYKTISLLTEMFNVDYPYILQRLINDLEIFKNVALLRFIKYTDATEWRLTERYLSNEFNNNKIFYIPFRNKKELIDNRLRYPSCGKHLNLFLDGLQLKLSSPNEVKINIKTEILLDKPLKTFFKNFEGQEYQKALISKRQSDKGVIMNLYFSF